MKRLLSAVAGLLVATALHAHAPEVSLWVTLGDSDQMTLTKDGRFGFVPMRW